MPKFALTAFLFKVAAGCLYGFIFLRRGGDTWSYHRSGLADLPNLKHHPFHFILSLFPVDKIINASSRYFDAGLKYYYIAKLSTIFSFFSGGRYFVNVIFYQLIVFAGSYYLLKAFVMLFNKKILFTTLLIFFYYPTVYWTSGFHRDGLLFFFLSVGLYHFVKLLSLKNKSSYLYLALSVIFLFFIRSFVGVTFACALIFWQFFNCEPFKKLSRYGFWYMTGTFLLIIFFSHYTPFDLYKKIVEKHNAFAALYKDNKYLLSDKILTPDLSSFVQYIPTALENSVWRPYFSELFFPLNSYGAKTNILGFLEKMFIFSLLIIALISNLKHKSSVFRSLAFQVLLAFVFLNYLLIGYTIPFLNALMRYRTSAELLLIILIVQCISSDDYKYSRIKTFRAVVLK